MAQAHDGRLIAMTRDLDALLLIREIEEFLFHEARLLDERRFEEWMDLFTDDGIYWMPTEENQQDGIETHSIFHDDKALMDHRVRRLNHPLNYAQTPPSRFRHLIGNVVIEDDAGSGGEIQVRSSLVAVEYWRERQRVFAGDCHHRLRREPDGLRIVFKRVDLANCDAIHEHMSVPI